MDFGVADRLLSGSVRTRPNGGNGGAMLFTDLSVDVALGACCCDVHVWEILTEVQHAGFQGRGSASLLQMCPKHFGRRSVVEALSRLVVEMASKLDEVALIAADATSFHRDVASDGRHDII